MHGHIKYLSERSDFIFLPDYLDRSGTSDRDKRRQYCYYTQFITPVISAASITGNSEILSPVLYSLNSRITMIKELYMMMKKISGGKHSFNQVYKAYKVAEKADDRFKSSMHAVWKKSKNNEDLNVMIVGRPYTVLSKSMNKGIPDIFGRLGVKAFYQDMIQSSGKNNESIKDLMGAFHWNYAAKIIDAANTAAQTEGLYPVLVTSFKCTPDSYAIEYFKKILDSYNKPYLILQIDEHDSSVGYETRIEAGIRAFRNHFAEQKHVHKPEYKVSPEVVSDKKALFTKTLLLANWDDILGKFMVSILQREGVDARLLEESREMIQRSLSTNTGQCIPLNIIVQEGVEYVRKYNLDPAKTILWNIDSRISCNLGMFPYFSKTLLSGYGEGMEKIDLYMGKITFYEMSFKTSVNMYLAFMLSGYIRRIGCRLRPYEIIKGETDRVLAESVRMISDAFLKGSNLETELDVIIKEFEKIETRKEKRPKVAIFGDFYVRDNDIMNQNLIRTIEENGGEVLTTPYSELVKIIAEPYLRKWIKEGNYMEVITSKVLLKAMSLFERRYYRYFEKILKEPAYSFNLNTVEILDMFDMKIENSGESVENTLKIYSLYKHYDDISLFVQLNPAFCCPSLVTEAMAARIENVTGIPIVTIEYDGTGGLKNQDIIPYLKFPRKKAIAGENQMEDEELCKAAG